MAIIKLKGYTGRAAQPPHRVALRPRIPCSPWGDRMPKVTRRALASSKRGISGRAVAYGKFGYPDALVLSMGTQKGESGGPLFDSKGELIGMVVSTRQDANGNLINLAHAIPSTALAKFLCAETQCAAPWAALATVTVDSCGGA